MRAFYSDHHAFPLPEGHRFPLRKYRMLREALLSGGLLAEDRVRPAPLASREELALVHGTAYLDAVFDGTLTAAEQRRIGLPWSPELLARSRASVGGTLAASRVALREGIAGNLAGGTHHAFADHGEGYCVFNDLAVSVRVLREEGEIRRAAVIDLDVHQGNGTAAIFANDAAVFTFSMHGAKNFPFRKQLSHLDLELDDGTADDEYLAILEENLPRVLDAAQADLLLYQAGVDALAHDTLGRLALTHEGLRRRDRFVFGLAQERGIPLVLTMGGGYAKPIEASIEAHVGTYREAAAVYGP